MASGLPWIKASGWRNRRSHAACKRSCRHLHGLAEDEARHRLTAEGPNELPAAGTRSPWRIAFEILREPMFALLLAGGAIYVAIGDLLGGVVLLSVRVACPSRYRSCRRCAASVCSKPCAP